MTKFLLTLIGIGLLWFVFMLGRLTYEVHVWAPAEKTDINARIWQRHELDFRPLPYGMCWARPKDEHKPEHWEYFNNNRWKFALLCDEGTVLIDANIFPLSEPQKDVP